MRSINLGRWSRRVERYFNMKGGGGLMDVEQTVRVVLPIASGPEDRYLEGWNIFHGSTDVAAVAAQFSRTLLRNPAGSNVVAVVEQFSSVLPFDYLIVTGQPNLGTVQAAGAFLRRLDARGGFTDATCVLSQDTNATSIPGTAGVLIKYFAPAAPQAPIQGILTVNQEIPILPGDGLWFVSDTVNTRIAINLRWRERALEASELT